MPNEFDGLIAIVTGGASGIGAAATRQLIDRGARVAVLDIDIQSANPDAFTVPTDVGDDTSVRNAVAAVAAHYGGVDIVINNAGIGPRALSKTTLTTSWPASLTST